MHLDTREFAGEVGQSWIPVVPVGDDEKIGVARLAPLRREFPATAVEALSVGDSVAEFDLLAKAEGVGVVVEVLLDQGVVREVGVVVGHREITKRQLVLGRIDVQ